MKGLELSKRFFHEWALPYLEREFPSLLDRLAAGLIGGSQSIGADDELSRDHGWGPQFSIWLLEEDYVSVGELFSEKINLEAPRSFLGFSLLRSNDKSISVYSIDRFFEYETGYVHPPPGIGTWDIDYVVESHLYFIKHGAVFHDQLGEFTKRRREFSQWPYDVYLDRVRGCCYNLWHFGEYNFCTRVTKRNDAITMFTCLGHFIDAAMRLCFYLNDDFTPYWKWMPYKFRKIYWAIPVQQEIEGLIATPDLDAQVSHVKSICNLLREQLFAKGLISREDAPDMGRSEIVEKINKLKQENGK